MNLSEGEDYSEEFEVGMSEIETINREPLDSETEEYYKNKLKALYDPTLLNKMLD